MAFPNKGDSEGVAQHKRLAMGQSPDGGDFGVESLDNVKPGGTAQVGRPRKSHLKDHERAAGPPIPRSPGYHPAQANADHGKHYDGDE